MLTEGQEGSKTARIILHIDFDYFFAQCEEIRDHSLKTKPVVVCVFSGRGEDSGVVSTANYKAREYHVKSGIPIKLAKSRLAAASDAVFLPLDSNYYSEMSEKAMSVIRSLADNVERVGIDECYIDVSGKTANYELASQFANRIKDEVKKRTRLTCSIGVAPNKMLAKMASDAHKPDGLTVIEPAVVGKFISQMIVEKVPGIGPKTGARLRDLGVNTVGDLATFDLFKLIETFGKKTATYMHNAASGIDDEPVVDSDSKKQIGRIVTLKGDATTSVEMYPELYKICQSVLKTANTNKLSFKTVGVILVLDDLNQRSKSKSLKAHTNNFETLHSTAKSILDQAMASPNRIEVRRLGLRLSDFRKTAGQNTMSQFIGG